MFRTSIIPTAVLAALCLTAPAGAFSGSADAALRLEAQAVANSAQAVRLVEDSTAKAKAAVHRSELALRRAYRIVQTQGHAASVQFSAAAEAQGDNLAGIVQESRGSLEKVAAGALAETARMEAAVVSTTAAKLESTQTATTEQGEDATAIGEAHASLTADVVVAASTDRLRAKLRTVLDRATAHAIAAQARLALAVEELRARTSGQAQSSMAAAEASMEEQGAGLVKVLLGSGRWEVTYDKTVGTNSPVSASASLHATVVVEQGDRR